MKKSLWRVIFLMVICLGWIGCGVGIAPAPVCVGNEDCGGALYCMGGNCRELDDVQCDEDQDCPDGTSCEEESGVCVEG